MIKRKRPLSIDTLKLTNPQRAAVGRILTAQKNKYKKLLHEAHERMHIIADMSTSLEIWYNVNGNYEYVSRSCEAILGYPPEAFTRGAVRLEQLVHHESEEQFRQDRAAALEGLSGERVEYRILTREGETCWVEAHWNPVLTRKGKHIGIRISLRDITEFKQCQSFSRAYESLSLTIANELEEVGIFSVTPDVTFKSWNAGAAGMLGWKKEDIIGGHLSRITEAEDVLRIMDASREAGCDGKQVLDVSFRTEVGGTLPVQLMLLNLCDHKQQLHQITFLFRPTE
ncbi:MAG: PAS domain S-box protein [Bacteroidetes bacterium]|nr:PAS domain S-box protein [Bacteroidota bacterium]